MSILSGPALASARGPCTAAAPAPWRQVLGRVARAWKARRAERHLETLDDAMLKDIGLSRADLHYAARHGRARADVLRP